MKLDERQLGTVLAALRYWQQIMQGPHPRAFREIDDEIATDGRTFPSLDAKEIDALCESLNCDTKRRLANTGSHIEAYAKALDGLELHKLVIGGDRFDGARDARAIRRVVEHLLRQRTELAAAVRALLELAGADGLQSVDIDEDDKTVIEQAERLIAQL